jgi:hypothetical protein
MFSPRAMSVSKTWIVMLRAACVREKCGSSVSGPPPMATMMLPPFFCASAGPPPMDNVMAAAISDVRTSVESRMG